MNDREQELLKICEEYPRNIPLAVAAEFLGTSTESLRAAIAQGTAGFAALSWRKLGKSNHGYLIPTMAFYNAMIGRR